MASTTDLHETAQSADDHGDHGDHDHPSDRHYVEVALKLAGLTAAEVFLFVIEESLPRWSIFALLTLLMIVKFFIVAAEFMHLKFDHRLFTQLFVAGLVLAMGVYAIFFFAFDLFGLG